MAHLSFKKLRLFPALLLALFVWQSSVADEKLPPNTLRIYSNTTGEVDFYLGNKPVWKPGLETHTVAYSGSEYTFVNDRDTGISLLNRDWDSSGQENILADLKISINDNILTVATTDRAASLKVVNAAGLIIISREIEAESQATTDLGVLDAGVYIITAGNTTLKFLKR